MPVKVQSLRRRFVSRKVTLTKTRPFSRGWEITCAYTPSLRLLETFCDYYDMIGWLLAKGLNVVPSAYLWCLDANGNKICQTPTDTGTLANNAEVTALINLMTSLSPADRAKIPFVVVGSEAVSFGGMSWGTGSANDLQPYIEQVKNALSPVMVTTAEIYYQYLYPAQLCQYGTNGSIATLLGDSGDLVFVNIHPYNEGVLLGNAVTCISDVYGSLNAAYPQDKPIVISETGWPSYTSVNDQQTFWQSLIATARQNNIEYFGFEAFDEAWKSQASGNAYDATWGLWDQHRQPKAPCGIVSFNPPTSFIASPTSGSAPLPVTFRASGLTPTMTYTINFGDGTIGHITRGSCIVTANPGHCVQCSYSASHTYSTAGTDTAALLNASGVPLGAVTINVGGGVSPSPVGGGGAAPLPVGGGRASPLPITHH